MGTKTKKIEEENRRKFTIPSGASFQLRSKNAIYISSANSLRHELTKFLICYMIHKYGDFVIDPELKPYIWTIEKLVKSGMKDFPKNPTSFITEAVVKKSLLKEKEIEESDRRVDVVNLKTLDFIEVETKKSVTKSKSVTVRI